LIANRHYIPLEKDFSNLDHVLERINDIPALQAMADQAYEDLIASGAYSYKAYAQFIERLIQDNPRRRALPLSPKTFGSVATHIEGPAAEAPTHMPLGVSGYNVRQWGWISLQIAGDWDDLKKIHQKRATQLLDCAAAYRQASQKLNLKGDEVTSMWAAWDDAVGQVALWQKLKDDYDPQGSRDFEYELGYLAIRANSLETAFDQLRLKIEPMIASAIKQAGASLGLLKALNKARQIDNRAQLKRMLSKIPLLARITNRLL
jgi:hypothetical protein